MSVLQVYRRTDDKYAWRLIANNGNVIATDGGQGYENKNDAVKIASDVLSGSYSASTIEF